MRKVIFSFLVILCWAHAVAQHTYRYVAERACKVKLGNIDSVYVTAARLLANTRLTSTENTNCKVVGFSFTLFGKGRDYIGPYFAQGPEFTEEMKVAIRKFFLGPGDEILLDNIKLLCGSDTCKGLQLIFRGLRSP